MARHKITLLPGDGIGPEVTAAVVSIIECAGVDVEWENYFVGSEAFARFGDPLPKEVLESILRNKVALKGPVTTPVGTGFTSINVRLRKTLDLYANLRPVRSMPNIITRFENVDLVVVRENTEDLYSGLEHEVVPGVVESLKIITERASTRIARFAFEYARTHGRKKVTAVHKANIMKMSDGLFLNCFRNVAKQYPSIKADDKIVDNLCMQLVVDPLQFDILLLENLYGDIVSDLAAGLVGGLGVVAGANIGENGAVFEAVHGSAPDIAGQNKANPLALLQSAVLMLQHIREMDAASRIQNAIVKVLASGPEHRTRDIGGKGSTSDFTAAMCDTLRRGTRAGD
jgi:isocitrate dehydrogenase (NAD+)